ncbi:hypothetical protein F5B22DRAFT_15426 [Xylaria bambusicola]|uniref:uncharacterized protein n=1 Tax=Xylaria bambusicola TaxID=326684 RepID=UPI0020074147|nr:uncharacterized protein F5B22DRAFT_15426 [Xylaria bambusicola]KAI0528010.1 hypothetical protein F5B22DRAFT_15426 [Xylaria bambusicola]
MERRVSIYNGVSNRPRGWKTWKPQRASQSESPHPTVMKWDGASRTSEVWDNLRRDPELWFREGDCNVYLHTEGQSRRGAAFKVPYSMLLESQFQPLIKTFKPRARNDISIHPEDAVLGPIELFIPAPLRSDKRQSYSYHIATRNLFAFIFQKPIVGECLGAALITLMEGLNQLRAPDADNVQDIINYMDKVGYLDFNSQPTYALAILRLADVFELRELYINAFAHCCGIGGQIFLHPGYQLLSPMTRALIRRVRREMNFRLGEASIKMKTFLDDQLKELDNDLYPRAGEHLQLFRTFLENFYTGYFGQYPPPSIDAQAMIFGVDTFRTFRNDFEALYELLADRSFKAYQSSDYLSESRMCILRSIRSLDSRCNYENLLHPLPLLPDITRKKPALWRMSWPTRTNYGRLTTVLEDMSKATNSVCSDESENHLVVAYLRFEEEQIAFPSNENLENQDRVEGRKVRWILIYAIYQTLLRATKVPLEVRDTIGVPYHVCISTADLPPWKDNGTRHTQSDRATPSPLPPSHMLETMSDNGNFIPTNHTASDTTKRPKTTMLDEFILKDDLETLTSRGIQGVEPSLSCLNRRSRSVNQENMCREDVVDEHSNRSSLAAKYRNETRGQAAETSRISPDTQPSEMLSNSSTSIGSGSSLRYSTSEAKTSYTSDTYVASTQTPSPRESKPGGAICGLRGAKPETIPSTSRWPRPLRVEALREYMKKQTVRHSGRFSPTLAIRRPLSAQERSHPADEHLNRPTVKGKSTSDLVTSSRVSWPLGRPA